jgi:hypothetical protein
MPTPMSGSEPGLDQTFLPDPHPEFSPTDQTPDLDPTLIIEILSIYSVYKIHIQPS